MTIADPRRGAAIKKSAVAGKKGLSRHLQTEDRTRGLPNPRFQGKNQEFIKHRVASANRASQKPVSYVHTRSSLAFTKLSCVTTRLCGRACTASARPAAVQGTAA